MQIKLLALLLLYTTALPTWSAFGVEVLSEKEATITLKQESRQEMASEIRLLLWNVYKKGKDSFKSEYQKILKKHRPNTLLVQEAYSQEESSPTPKEDNTRLCLVSSDCYFSSAFTYEFYHYGVLTSSQFLLENPQTLHSDMTEPVLSTPKTSLMTELHGVGQDNSSVLVINTHGINFVSLIAYDSQLREVVAKVSSWKGPIVWAGDFNSWNPGRMSLLNRATEELGLTQVEFKNAHLIKSFLGYRLDHAFFRGLKVTEAEVIKTKGSDHNALFMVLEPK